MNIISYKKWIIGFVRIKYKLQNKYKNKYINK